MKNSISINTLTRLALLFAITIVLMLIEGAIPPIATLPPGVKLGISNIVMMYTLFFLGKKEALILLLLKAFFIFLTRGLFAFFISTSGGILSILVMIFMLGLKKYKISYIIVSVCAAIAHNVGQLLAASVVLANVAAFYYLPILIISGIIMGAVTGTVLKFTLPAMKRFGLHKK